MQNQSYRGRGHELAFADFVDQISGQKQQGLKQNLTKPLQKHAEATAKAELFAHAADTSGPHSARVAATAMLAACAMYS